MVAAVILEDCSPAEDRTRGPPGDRYEFNKTFMRPREDPMTRIRLILGLAALLVAAPAAVADQYRVMVGNFFFEPSELSVLTGDTVGWRNHDGTHSTTADDFTWDS